MLILIFSCYYVAVLHKLRIMLHVAEEVLVIKFQCLPVDINMELNRVKGDN